MVALRLEAAVLVPADADGSLSSSIPISVDLYAGVSRVARLTAMKSSGERPIDEEGLVESQDISEPEPQGVTQELPLEVKPLEVKPAPKKARQSAPKPIVKPVVQSPDSGKVVPVSGQTIDNEKAEAEDLKKPTPVAKPRVTSPVPIKPAPLQKNAEPVEVKPLPVKPVKAQKTAPVVKPVEADLKVEKDLKTKSSPATKTVPAKLKKDDPVQEPVITKARPVVGDGAEEKSVKPASALMPKPAAKAAGKDLKDKSQQEKSTKAPAPVDAATSVDAVTSVVAEPAAETAKKPGEYSGPIEIRAKRLFGFDGQLSGTKFGWVDQVFIDDLNDEVYLLDKNSNRIVVTNISGGYLFHFDYSVAGINHPTAFTVDTLSGEIYLSSSNSISILNYRGEYQGSFNFSQMPGSKKISIQSLSLVKGDDGDLIYIGDNKNRRILVFTTGGKYVRTVGGDWWVGNNIKGLQINKDTIFWLDSTGYAVKSIGLDGKNKRSFGRLSSLMGGFSMPSNMTVDDINKRIIVVDSNRMMVIFFDYEGNTLFEFGGPRVFSWPRAVAVDSRGRIFIADNSGVISVFSVVLLPKEFSK